MTEENNSDDSRAIGITKIYVKDYSFESPRAPDVFRTTEWKPQTDLNIRSGHTAVEGEEDLHEVVLTITVDAKEGDSTLFLVEIQQAGLFQISGYSEEEFNAIVGSFCPNILFPYAREAIATTVQRGGFPEFVLQPINFDALYMKSREQIAQQAAGSSESH
jgi:preprotein translocase subunit SecB